jgi:hypothetical protein
MVRAGPPALDHLLALTDDVGILQHARRRVPSRAHGYCIDDVGRALIVACDAAADRVTAGVGGRLLTTYLAYVVDAQLPDGWFHNFLGYDRRWQDDRGTDDSFARACWGLGYVIARAPRPADRSVARDVLRAALPHVATLTHLRSRAYAVLGLARVVVADRFDAAAATALRAAASGIADAYRAIATPEWRWCEPVMTYDNARLCEALLRAGSALRDPFLVAAGRAMLDFLASVTIENDVFVPIGSAGWYPRGGVRARFGQQPLEAAALVDAALLAREVTGDERYGVLAQYGYGWFFGRNVLGATLVDGGGCRDGIDEHGINENMGAESTLAYLLSAYAVDRASLQVERSTLLRASRI